MSDRHIVEKKFNSLLEEYHLQVLSIVIDNWVDLNVEEQQSISTLNNFFCDLHRGVARIWRCWGAIETYIKTR